MKTFKQLLEDIEITDRTGKAYDFAKGYIDQYRDSFRPTPEIITKGPKWKTHHTSFVLRGPDEKFVADMLTGRDTPRGGQRFNALKNVKITQRKVK